MSTVHVITNGNGSGDRCLVYETETGSVIFDDEVISSHALVDILNNVMGYMEYVELHELTDEQMENWEEEIYP